MSGIMRNVPPSESTRLTPTMLRLSEALAGVKKFMPGDALTIEFDPQAGTVFKVNGKQTGETIPGAIVFDGAVHIWLGPGRLGAQGRAAGQTSTDGVGRGQLKA